MAWIVRGRPPVLSRPDEEDLHTGDPAIHLDGEHICLFDVFRVHILTGTHMGQRPDPVAQARRTFKFHVICRRFHIGGEALLQVGPLSAQEVCRLIGKGLIVLGLDQPDAGRRTALDLVQHAGPRAHTVDTVLTGAQQEGFLQCVQRPHDRPGTGERTEIVALIHLGPAILLDLGRFMVPADQDVGKRFVVTQQYVETRLKALDETRFQQQRFGLRLGDHELHPLGHGDHAGDPLGMTAEPRIVRDPRLQVARLAHIQDIVMFTEHAIDARLCRQSFEIVLDDVNAP